jgi:hypothetical protein
MWHDHIVPTISRVFLMLAVAGLWIERHKQLSPASSFLRLYRQALNEFATLINYSSCEGFTGTEKNLGPLDTIQVQPSRPLETYDRREIRMRW